MHYFLNDALNIAYFCLKLGIVINITDKASVNRDAELEVSDIEQWELQNGQIPAGSIVLMNSGWGVKWNDRDDYLGFDEQQNMHFPGLGQGH